MLSRVFLMLLPVAALGVGLSDSLYFDSDVLPRGRAGAGFSYNRCDLAYGPSNWTGSCKSQAAGTFGTPVNLCGAVAFPAPGAPAISLTGYNVSRTMNIANGGSGITISFPSGTTNIPTLQAGNLAQIVGKTSNATTQTWVLEQMHLHWGRYGMMNEGSEHYLQGTAYAAEAHFVHYNSRFGSFTAAVAASAQPSNADALLVVGVFLSSSATSTDQSATITTMAAAGVTATSTPTAMSTPVTLSDLYDGTGAYYSYSGGLTTPGCNEIVTWVVSTTPKTMSSATLNNLWKISQGGVSGAELISKYGNYRDPQPIGSRTIYLSSGTSAACTSVTYPNFNCQAKKTNGGLVAGPQMGLHFSLLALALFALWR